ncbi:CGNR zinc finger domain-containing protein [Mycobacterium shigaense]|uniref:CGNR zinc finger domain-containing protein n=1 Tax=Mycobacterium shigaense TaxID=722731 RepID=UPI001F08D4CC|nr:CGNR zinc finger domain-containing protein [Mycobacterium shigaense]MEA1121299.1 CGNR zinc finger domain-containing protein [Mycobacterium shigaense]
MSQWSASHRYELATAPGGLGLVQDFLNTVGIGDYGPDLLADGPLAQQWSAGASRTWSALRGVPATVPALTEGDLSKLRALRDTIAKLVRGEQVDDSVVGTVSASFGLCGNRVQLKPAGSGWRWLASILWAEILLSQQADTFRRLKQCQRHGCDSTFYDRSKNNSGVWHNVKTCGNAENLRASRARRRERERAGDALSPAPTAGAAGRGPS